MTEKTYVLDGSELEIKDNKEVFSAFKRTIKVEKPAMPASTTEAFKEVNRRLYRIEKWLYELSLELNKRGQR